LACLVGAGGSGWSAAGKLLGLPLEALHDPFLGEREWRGLVVRRDLTQLLVRHQRESQLVDLRPTEAAACAGRLRVALGGKGGQVRLELVVREMTLLGELAFGAMAAGVGGIRRRLAARSTTSGEKHLRRITNGLRCYQQSNQIHR